MILIVGGLSCGKREFAMRELGAALEEMSDAMDEKPILFDLQSLSPLPGLEALLEKKMVICNEVGCGVVPIDQTEREHRETVGRLCVELARQAQAVYRVQCGIGMRLK